MPRTPEVEGRVAALKHAIFKELGVWEVGIRELREAVAAEDPAVLGELNPLAVEKQEALHAFVLAMEWEISEGDAPNPYEATVLKAVEMFQPGGVE